MAKFFSVIGKIFVELFFVAIAALITIGGVLFALQTIQNTNNFDKFEGNIKRQEIHLFSPVFGSIQKMDLREGDSVKKGQLIARIKFVAVGKENVTLINSDIFDFDLTGVDVISPEDGVVAHVNFAQGSVVRSETDFLVIYPFRNTFVEFKSENDIKMADYSKFSVADENKDKELNLITSNDAKEGRFENTSDAAKFYDKEKIEVKAERKKNNDLIFSQIALQLSSLIQKVKI